MSMLLVAALFVIAAEIGIVLVWDDAAFAWVAIFYPAAFLLAIGLGELDSEIPLISSNTIGYLVVALIGFLLGSVWAAWWTKKLR